MKSEINLVILTPGFAADDKDSVTIPSLQLFLGKLNSLYPEINIHIISFHYPFVSGHYVWKGIPVFASGGSKCKAVRIFLWIRIFLYLYKYWKKNGIDIIHTFFLNETTLLGLLFGWIKGVPVLATAMGQDVKKKNRYLAIIRLFKPDIVTISEFQANSIPGFLNNNLRNVIPFGIDPYYFMEDNANRSIDILGVGSLNEIKNYSDFIDIISSLIKIFPGLNCGIIGEGNKRKEIENYILDNHLQDRITLLGELPYEKTIKKMQESKILLHTSLFEGQGLIITEALAAGAYVVSYPVGTAWSDKNEKLRTGGTKKELENQIIGILNDRNPDYAPVIFKTIEDTCRNYYEIYRTLLIDK